MGVLDSPSRQAALQAIDRFGKPVSFTTGEQKRRDRATGKAVGTLDDVVECKALPLEVDRKGAVKGMGEMRIQGGLVGRDQALLVAALAIEDREPTTDWRLTDTDGREYRVDRAQPFFATEEVWGWVIVARA